MGAEGFSMVSPGLSLLIPSLWKDRRSARRRVNLPRQHRPHFWFLTSAGMAGAGVGLPVRTNAPLTGCFRDPVMGESVTDKAERRMLSCDNQ